MPAQSVRSFQLNTGGPIPAVGLGYVSSAPRSILMTSCTFRCFMGPTAVGESNDVTAMVKTALDLGYRHIDTVQDAESTNDIAKS